MKRSDVSQTPVQAARERYHSLCQRVRKTCDDSRLTVEAREAIRQQFLAAEREYNAIRRDEDAARRFAGSVETGFDTVTA